MVLAEPVRNRLLSLPLWGWLRSFIQAFAGPDMGAKREAHDPESLDADHGRTTLELTQLKDNRWRATQRDVDLVGYGETGALAAMDYCRKVAEDIDDEW